MNATAQARVLNPQVTESIESWLIRDRMEPGGNVIPFRRTRVARIHTRSVRTIRSIRRMPGGGEPCLSLIKVLAPVYRGTGRSDELGIDLIKRGHEVRKLFFAAFARGLVKDGYDPEDVLQEIYRGLLARNKGTCPFDVKKSSFGHYVHIVSRCVIANYVRKEQRRRAHESSESQLGGDDGLRFSMSDLADTRRGVSIEPGSLEVLSASLADLAPLGTGATVRAALQLLADGYSKREVVTQLKVESKWLEGVLSQAREALVR